MVQRGVRSDNLYVQKKRSGDKLESLAKENVHEEVIGLG